MTRLAIVGSGIAGLGLAYHLRNRFEITLYEKELRPGGHANTVEVPYGGRSFPIDTGFMVFNYATYPNLVKLFLELNVQVAKTDMSFSVQKIDRHLEYSGASFDRLFGDRKNLANVRFWKMLLEIKRFNEEGRDAALDPQWKTLSLQDYCRSRGYSTDFLNDYLLPMSCSIWSTASEQMLQFPAVTILRFFKNHGLLGVDSHYQWWTVQGGSREYVKKLLAALTGTKKLGSEVVSVKRGLRGVTVTASDGSRDRYDHVALACHADQAMKVLQDSREIERKLLGAFNYQENKTSLHVDRSVMPKTRRCWASWNHRLDGDGASTHYWMNSLQNISRERDYFVSLNAEHLINPKLVLKRMVYHHPVFDLQALQAQEQLSQLNQNSYRDQIFFCGSYFGYGFHEDALCSSLRLAEHLTGKVLC